MSSSREDSPDWLHCFQAPAQSPLPLSLGSESPSDESPISEDEKDKDKDKDGGWSSLNENSKEKSPSKKPSGDQTPARNRKRDNPSTREGSGGDRKVAKKKASGKSTEPREPKHSVWTLSSDSEFSADTSPLRNDDVHHKELSACKKTQYPEKDKDKDSALIHFGGDSPLKEASTVKSPKKWPKTEDYIPTKKKNVNSHINKENDGELDAAKGEVSEKHTGPYVSSSRLPLVLSEKVQRSKALVECEGESIDLSGDVGAVGRIVISDNPSRNHEMFLDLKGTIYKTTIVPSRTFCVVSFGPSEAKIEAIMNDFIQLKPQSNVYEAETMVEGTLDGFSFDSEDEADNLSKVSNHQTDKNENVEEQAKGKTRRKAEKTSGVVQKKSKTAGGKPSKKVKRKSQAPKKTKSKK